MKDLPKRKPRRYSYIYLVQYPEDIKEHVVKVGRTVDIKRRYKKKVVDIIGIEYVDDMYEEEKILINVFKKKYGEPVRGNEFLICYKIEDAIKIFYDVACET